MAGKGSDGDKSGQADRQISGTGSGAGKPRPPPQGRIHSARGDDRSAAGPTGKESGAVAEPDGPNGLPRGAGRRFSHGLLGDGSGGVGQ
jgi:hypothetical protein